jgi:hypothetical protein
LTPSPHQAPHVVVAGIAAFAIFGEDEFTVDADVKNSTATLDQFDLGRGLFSQKVPRTEGARQIVSNRAVFDTDAFRFVGHIRAS